MLEHVLEGHPEGVGHALFGGFVPVTGAQGGGRAYAGPNQTVAPWVLDEEESVVAVIPQVEYCVVVLSDQAEGFLFLTGQLTGTECH